MRTRAVTLRMAALVAVGSLAVHQLRFLLWYGHHSDGALSAQGHAYLMVVGPAVVAVAVLAFAGFLERLARGARAGAPGLSRLWLVLSGGLAAMFCVQETIEGMLSSGHPGGLAGIAGQGGWLAAPLSAVVGLALAIALRGSTHAAELLTPGGSPRPALPVAPLSVHASVTLPPRRGPWLAVASARAPPGASA